MKRRTTVVQVAKNKTEKEKKFKIQNSEFRERKSKKKKKWKKKETGQMKKEEKREEIEERVSEKRGEERKNNYFIFFPCPFLFSHFGKHLTMNAMQTSKGDSE